MTANTSTTKTGSNSVFVFVSVGHLYIHLCTSFYFVIILSLEQQWGIPYYQLIELWTLGSLLVGIAALPAGLLSDKVGARNMMIAFFIGMGGCSVLAGLAFSPRSLFVALSGIGLFASIYHPVGIPWLVRTTTTNRGKALGLNGVFGAAGSALSGLVTGVLIDVLGWRAAFAVPGIFCIVTGVFLYIGCLTGRVSESSEPQPDEKRDGVPSRRVFPILLVTMFLGGFIFHTTQVSLPKLFEQRNDGLVGDGAFGVGVLIALVYGMAGLMQVIGGHLADRFSLKKVYVAAIASQIPALWGASQLLGVPLVVVATMMVMANASALPAENLLLAFHTPAHRHGFVFGLKFVLSFGAAPLAVQFVSFFTRNTEQLSFVYSVLAVVAMSALVLACILPRNRKSVSVI